MIKIESVKIKNYEAVDIVKGQINNSGVYGVKAVMDFSLELMHLRTLDSFKEVKGSTRDIVGVSFECGIDLIDKSKKLDKKLAQCEDEERAKIEKDICDLEDYNNKLKVLGYKSKTTA